MLGDKLIFVHSSDEHYGADRIVLDLHAALPEGWNSHTEFWLPTDVTHGTAPLCVELERRGATVRHVDLPILRRAYRTPRELLKLAGRVRRLRREIRSASPAMVYCTTSASFLAGPVARRAAVPIVVGHIQELWSRSDTQVLGRLSRSFDRLVAISEPVRDALPADLRPRTAVVLNATSEPDTYVPLAGREGPLNLLVASRWNSWKGHRTLLRAWDSLDPPGVLVVLGGPPASGEAVDVAALARDLRFPDSVRVVGEVPDAHRYIEQADVVIVPSDQPEPFGLVAVEALASGRPVVGSDAGGLADIVTSGTDGWLFPPGDVGALAQVLLGLTRGSVNAAGAAARSTYRQRFTADRYARDWLAAVDLPNAPTDPPPDR